MAKRIVVWTETSARQRRAVLEYLTKRNGSIIDADKLIQLTAKHIQIILSHPEPFKSNTYPDTRESAMGHFSIYYKLTNDKLIVTAFWDNRQNPKRVLKIIQKGDNL